MTAATEMVKAVIASVSSRSSGQRYQVMIHPDFRKCSCPGHFFHKTDCKHIRLVLIYLDLQEQVEII